MDLNLYIRTVKDFPKPGIGFKDITPLLKAPEAFEHALQLFRKRVPDHAWDSVLGIESRGFIFGAALAQQVGKPFVPARKPGKLPWKTVERSYQLEYGEDSLQVHADAFNAGERVLIVDDLLATGGTLQAAVELVRDVGAHPVAALLLVELGFLPGRKRIEALGLPVHTLLCYDSEVDE